MSKYVLAPVLMVVCVLLSSGCGSIITKPLSLATKAVVTPVKAVAGVATDVVAKPLRKTAQVMRPVTPVIRVR
jgi:uncharacterized protein YceK